MTQDATALGMKILELKRELAERRRQESVEPVEDYTLAGPDGGVRLSDLFGDKSDLIVAHNMGKGCTYCTMWADGYNGVLPHLENRAAFVVVSPDDPATQRAFASERGWNFRMCSGQGSTFIEDMGFRSADGGWMPGVSTFRKSEDGSMARVASAPFGPGDDFCSVWHFFDLLSTGADSWEPKDRY